HAGVTGADGGLRIRAARNAARAAARRDAAYMRKYGCTVTQWREIVDHGEAMRKAGASIYRTPTRAFSMQRANAHRRGIEWKLTRLEWWSVWQDSRKWEQRGRGRGYMMCRAGDVGAYEIGNVYIATGVHNSKV